MNDELIDTRLGQYHITEVIRRGGMSTVYKAYQASLERYVAVKVLRYNRDPQFAARFKREARAIAKLQHHNILPIYDYDEQDDLLYLVLQYIENGQTLADMLGAPFEPSAALRLVGHLLNALDYAHTRGIIHRDMKPSNVLMPSPTWPMLADFGIAKLLNDNQAQLTVPGLIIGTAAYMAPEQATGQPIDVRTDLYSTGVMLYEMVTGRVPFDADTPMAVLTRQAYEPPPPPRSLNPDLPTPVEAALLKALAKDPAARYQTAAAMAADLGRLANQIEQGRARGQITGFYQAGVRAFEAGHWDEAVEQLGQLVALDPDYEDAPDLLEAAREAQEQARVAARQQLEQVRQRRQSTLQQQLAAPATPVLMPTPKSEPALALPATHETRRLEPVVPPPPAPDSAASSSSAAGPAPATGTGTTVAPPWGRYALWAIVGVVVVVLALFLIRSGILSPPDGQGLTLPTSAASAPSAAPATAVAPTQNPAGGLPTAPAPTSAPPTTPAPGGGPPPPSPGKLVYTDDFGAALEAEKEKSGLEDQRDAPDFQRGFHSPGVYHFKLLHPNETYWEVLPRFAYRDFSLQIELWDNSDNFSGDVAQGVIFRMRDNDHFYALLIDPRKGQYSIRKRAGPDHWTDLVVGKSSRLIKQKTDHNLLRLDAAGDTFTIYLNNARLDSFNDGDNRFGMVGMIVANGDAITPHMHFDNLKVWSADSAATGEVLPARDGMVVIAGGEFVMGSYQRDDQEPPHIVAVKGFYLDLTEVTNAAYEQCVVAGKCARPAELKSYSHPSYYTDPQYADYPVVDVTWEQARAYCDWAGKRLPTEAEWEMAASWSPATRKKTIWPWDGPFDTSFLNTDARLGDTSAVKQFPAELNGTFDMAGNVSEWTSSRYLPYPYNEGDGREDLKAIGERVFRGGSWAQSTGAHAAFRNHAAQTDQDFEIGFRCAASP